MSDEDEEIYSEIEVLMGVGLSGSLSLFSTLSRSAIVQILSLSFCRSKGER